MAIGGVALYVRTSSDDPENSGEAQLEVLKRFARQNGMLVAKVFFQARNDQGTIDQMMAEATGDDHPFRLILATSRNQSQEFWQAKQQWRERLEQARVDIVSVPDPQENAPSENPPHPHAGHGHELHQGRGREGQESHGGDGRKSHQGHDHEGNERHGHGHAHDHASELREASSRSLIIALVLISGFMVAGVVGGILSGSLALLAGAGHMLTNAASIALALLAPWLAGRPESIERLPGYRRSEVLAACGAISLSAIAGWIVWEAIERLLNHQTIEIEGGLMLAVGGLGLAVNLAAALVLQAGSKHSLNVDGTFRHLLANLIGSVGVVASGVVVLLTGWLLIDPILSVGIALLIIVGSWRPLLRSVNALLKVPDHMDLYAHCAEIEDVPGVALIHDVHLFTITPNFEFLTVHILIDPSYKGGDNGLQESMRRIASGKYGIHHVTLQLCWTAGECPENHFARDPKAVARPSL